MRHLPLTALLAFVAVAASANPVAELCPTCADAEPMCSPDRVLMLDGTALIANDARIDDPAGVRPVDLGSMGATCDCINPATGLADASYEVHTSVYKGYLALGANDPYAIGRLPACRAEAVYITLPVTKCPTQAVLNGAVVQTAATPVMTEAVLAVPRGGTDTAPTWSIAGSAHTCVVDALTACPPGYSRSLTGANVYSADADDSGTVNVCRGYSPTSTRTSGISERIPRVGQRAQAADWYVTAVSMYSFPAALPLATCPDGTDSDSDRRCNHTYDPLPIYQSDTTLKRDYASNYLAVNAPEFFGSTTTVGNYYVENYAPPCETIATDDNHCTRVDGVGPAPSQINTPSANLATAFPLMSTYLPNSTVGQAMRAQRDSWAITYNSIPHQDGDTGHLCVGNKWEFSATSIYRAKPMLDDPVIYFEDGQSCPINAPLDTATGLCTPTAKVYSTDAVEAETTPAVACASGTVMPLYSGTELNYGATDPVQVGEYCREAVDLDSFRTILPTPATNATDRLCLTGHADYPSTMPSFPQDLLNIPQNVINDCKRSTLPANFQTQGHSVQHYPRRISRTVNLRHSPTRAHQGNTAASVHRFATAVAPTRFSGGLTSHQVASHACLHGQVWRGWFGNTASDFTLLEEAGAFCSQDDPDPHGFRHDFAMSTPCDDDPAEPDLQLPSGTLTVPTGMGTTAGGGRGPIVETLLPNGWRRSYPEVGTPEATCAAVTTEAACQGTRGCAWGNGACSNRGFNLIAPDCDCATYTGGSACPPAFPDACPSP